VNQQFITVDTREPWPHPWAAYLPERCHVERGTLETGDIALAFPEGAVIERKTPGDLVGCIGSGRERFERELRRGRYTGRMIVIVEGTLADVCVAGRRLHHNAIVGTIAAWTLRYCPFVFCGSERAAADFAFRFLAAQVRDIERLAKAIARLPDRSMIPPTFPSAEQLRPVLEKLEAHPGSLVLVAIEQPEVCNFCRVTWSWLSREERKALRRALEVCRRKRQRLAREIAPS
jgi:DNA excision repair protein ERCC-4